MESNFLEIENIIKYKFNDKDILKNSLNHYSDNIIKIPKDAYLEFLGDNHINNYISKLLYNYRIYENNELYNEYLELLKKYDFYDKDINYDNNIYKKLSTKQIGLYYNYLRSNDFLGNIGIKLNIDKYVMYNNKYPTNKIKIAANALESITGSILIDGSYKKMYIFLNNFLFDIIIEYINNNYDSLKIKKDNKTILQEIISKRTNKYPTFKNIKIDDNLWKTEIYLNNRLLSSHIENTTKKICEQECSKILIDDINNMKIII